MKTALLIITGIALTLCTNAADGDFVWARAMGGCDSGVAGILDGGKSIAVDALGNIYTTGYFESIADFNPGTDTFMLASAGKDDIFVSKLDTNGDFVWAKSMGGGISDNGLAIAVDAAGNVYTTGWFQGTADFDPGAGIFMLTSAGSADIFVSKLNVNGDLVWAKAMGGWNWDQANGIAVDAAGNVYTTGRFQGTADFDPGAGTFDITSAGNADIFVSKLDINGQFVWAKAMGGDSIWEDRGYGIAIDPAGNVYITGYFVGTADFEPGSGIFMLTSSGFSHLFVSKLDVNGNFVWAKGMGGGGETIGNAIAVDAAGNVYTTGIFKTKSCSCCPGSFNCHDICCYNDSPADFDPGPDTFFLSAVHMGDIFVSKLNANGDFVWAKGMGGKYDQEGSSIAVDNTGNVYTTGYFNTMNCVDSGDTDNDLICSAESPSDFDPGTNTFLLSAVYREDIFVAKLNANGEFVWAKQMGGYISEAGSAIALDAAGNVYTTGSFWHTVDFDPGAGIFTLTAVCKADIYISKLSGFCVEGAPGSVDMNGDFLISLSELLRLVQLYNLGAYHCHALGEDGYAPGIGNTNCPPHSGDYNPQDWYLDFGELLRAIQLYNARGYCPCEDAVEEDGYCPIM